MAYNTSQLVYAMDSKNQLVYIEDVDKGLACNCTCPACHARLIAKKGKIKLHHFAHHDCKPCANGAETTLHLAAKDILNKAKKMYLPERTIKIAGREFHADGGFINIEKVELEKRYTQDGVIIPDVVITRNNGKKLFVEIFVTHKVDLDKLDKIKDRHISAIEIDLSSLLLEKNDINDSLSAILLDDSPKKYWMYNIYDEIYNQYMINHSVLLPFNLIKTSHAGNQMHVDCPIQRKRDKNFKTTYANPSFECAFCKFCLKIDHDKKYVRCLGNTYIGSLKDISLNTAIRKMNYRMEKLECPECHEHTFKRNYSMKYGEYWLCDNCNYHCLDRKLIYDEINNTFDTPILHRYFNCENELVPYNIILKKFFSFY